LPPEKIIYKKIKKVFTCSRLAPHKAELLLLLTQQLQYLLPNFKGKEGA